MAISSRDPLAEWVYEFAAFGLAIWVVLRSRLLRARRRAGIPLLAISIWGFGQLLWGATVYRSGSINASLRMAALGATAIAAPGLLETRMVRRCFLQCFAWFASVLAVVSALAYFTSPNRILWMFASPYPDVWGPFLSRNNFAQFLELAFPVTWVAGG